MEILKILPFDNIYYYIMDKDKKKTYGDQRITVWKNLNKRGREWDLKERACLIRQKKLWDRLWTVLKRYARSCMSDELKE